VFLLDTNHCSRILDRDPAVIAQLQANAGAPIATSVITQGELVFMVEGSARRSTNFLRVSALLAGIRIYPVDLKTAEIYGSLKADLYHQFGPKDKAKRRRTTISQLGFGDNDLWIAAIALQHNLTIVSEDSDFKRIQEVRRITLISWISRDAE
jgi:tRNA(fMet)-specific endonuclease VapC